MWQMSLKRPVAFRQTGLNVRLFQSLCTERNNNVYGFTVNDPWRHSRRNDVRQWRETMGALCCWLPSSLQIGRLRGDGVGWWEVCACACARAHTRAVARIQWMDLERERRENSGANDSPWQTKPLFSGTALWRWRHPLGSVQVGKSVHHELKEFIYI